MQLARSRSSDA